VFESWYDEANAQSSVFVSRTRERGSSSPDLDMFGPNALPLSRDALKLSAPRNSSVSRKTE
jgi:hypothetical protein